MNLNGSISESSDKGFLMSEAYKIVMNSLFTFNVEYKTSRIGQDCWNMFFANGLSKYKLNNDMFIEADENVFVSETRNRIWITELFLVPKCSTIGTWSFPEVKRPERDF